MNDTKKNNGYRSVFIKLFGHVWGGAFFSGHGVYPLYYTVHVCKFADYLRIFFVG